MFKYLSLCAFAVLLGAGLAIQASVPNEHSLRMRAVQIKSDGGSCSGEQIISPRGKNYILTAGHCKKLLSEPGVAIIDWKGKKWPAKFVAEDPKSDLLLLRPIPRLPGLRVASGIFPQEHVRTFTHGLAYATYKTEGEMIQELHMDIFQFEISSQDDEDKCESMPKFKAIDYASIFGEARVCLLSVQENASTVAVVPGSSGGMVVDDRGELVGVVSAGNPSIPLFGYLVRLKDIHRFLKRF